MAYGWTTPGSRAWGQTQQFQPYQPEQLTPSAQAPANSTQVPGSATNSPQLPWDAAYASNISSLNLDLNNQLAAISAQKPGIQRDFGYLDSGAVDPNNPFSRARQLERSYDQRKRGNTTGYAAAGQLYSGALQNAQNEAQYNFQQSDTALRNSYAQQLAQLEAQRASAQNQYAAGVRQEEWNRLNTAIADRAAQGGMSFGGDPSPEMGGPTYGGRPSGPGTYIGFEPTGLEAAFRETHGGLSPAEYNYLQALYQAQQGRR